MIFNTLAGKYPERAKFWNTEITFMTGKRGIEDAADMISTHPLFDKYWATKSIHVENIDVPLYLTASYSTGLHSRGSFETFKKAKTAKKWLRVHPYQECTIIISLFVFAFFVCFVVWQAE